MKTPDKPDQDLMDILNHVHEHGWHKSRDLTTPRGLTPFDAYDKILAWHKKELGIPPNLVWGKHIRQGSEHTEWHTPCGCAYHPEPYPHVHACSDKHDRVKKKLGAIGTGWNDMVRELDMLKVERLESKRFGEEVIARDRVIDNLRSKVKVLREALEKLWEHTLHMGPGGIGLQNEAFDLTERALDQTKEESND